MADFVSPDRVPKELDGTEDWEYKYIEPVQGENETMRDIATRDRLLEARDSLVREYEKATLDWLGAGVDVDKAASFRTKRDAIAGKLKDDYWNLDPYLRARSLYDRCGMLQPGGKLDFYPKQSPATNGSIVVATSADDVD
jgi:hypothetical protein